MMHWLMYLGLRSNQISRVNTKKQLSTMTETQTGQTTTIEAEPTDTEPTVESTEVKDAEVKDREAENVELNPTTNPIRAKFADFNFKKYKPRHKNSVVVFGLLAAIFILSAAISDSLIVYKTDDGTSITFDTFVPFNETESGSYIGPIIQFQTNASSLILTIGTLHEKKCDKDKNECVGHSKFNDACDACKEIDRKDRPEQCKDTCSYQSGGIVWRFFNFFALGISVITSAIMFAKGDNIKVCKYAMVSYFIQLLLLIIAMSVYFQTATSAGIWMTNGYYDEMNWGPSAWLDLTAIVCTVVSIGFCATVKGVRPYH